jgi:hypothetical protein
MTVAQMTAFGASRPLARVPAKVPSLNPQRSLSLGGGNRSSLPPVTISNGLAQFQAIGLNLPGYVTPQGGLMMSSGVGQTFQGQIDNRNVLSGQVLGRCGYNLS